MFIKICESAGVQVKPEDISVIHLTGSKRSHLTGSKRSQAARLVLLKFTFRNAKRHLMLKKMEFKTKQELKRVYLNDDLTPIRSKLLKNLQTDPRNGTGVNNA
ncbi:hypothetical protein ACOMHN_012472 [Nucella lapillus]